MRCHRAIGALLALALALTACSRPRPIEARPALFVVRDADTEVWLLGTIHLLPGNIDWQTPAVNAAVARADMLVTEIPDAELQNGAATFERMAYAKGLPPALARIDPGHRAALLRAIDAAELTLAEAVRLKTWALATRIGSAAAQQDGASRDHGPEAVLAARFRRAHKPQRAFESLAGQLALFDGLAEADQRVLLRSAIDSPTDGARSYRATLAAWLAGDTARLAAGTAPDFAPGSTLRKTLIDDRNRRWTAWIARRMAQPGRVLVAVGAGHLVGTRSVIDLLRARGLRVTRVE